MTCRLSPCVSPRSTTTSWAALRRPEASSLSPDTLDSRNSPFLDARWSLRFRDNAYHRRRYEVVRYMRKREKESKRERGRRRVLRRAHDEVPIFNQPHKLGGCRIAGCKSIVCCHARVRRMVQLRGNVRFESSVFPHVAGCRTVHGVGALVWRSNCLRNVSYAKPYFNSRRCTSKESSSATCAHCMSCRRVLHV